MNIEEAKEKFTALVEAQLDRIAALKAEGDFVDYKNKDHIIIGVPIKLFQAGDAVFLAIIVKGKRDKANSQFLQQRAIQVGSGIGKDFVQDTEPSFI